MSSQRNYDVAIVLGTRFDENWGLRQDLLDRLDVVVQMYSRGEVKKIIVSGKWTIWYDWLQITPPTTESILMKNYLVERGVKHKDIIQEKKSKDTIGNLYYTRKILDDRQMFKHVVIICATERLERIRYISKHLLAPNYMIDYRTIDAPNDEASSLGAEKDIFIEQKRHIETIKSSMSRSSLQLYRLPYYTLQARAVKTGSKKSELIG